MKKYSITSTIAVWSDNTEIIKYINAIAKELKLNIFDPEHVVDLIAIPCFLKILDAKHFDILIRELSGSCNEYFLYNDCKIAIYGKEKTDMQRIPKNLIEEIPFVLSKKYFSKLIKQELDSVIKEDAYRKKQFKKRIFRIMALYHTHENGEYINIEKISTRFDIDARTFRRDLEALKKAVPKIDLMFERNDNITSMRASKKSKTSPSVKIEISERETQFINWVKRLIHFYQALKKGIAINVNLNCKKFSITDRSLRRDIKLLREINPERKISYNKVKGYY